MINYKLISCVLLFTIWSVGAASQTYFLGSNNTNSPYTRYGYGELASQNFAGSKAMGGVAYGLRDKYHINPANPASYTAVDSLTFLFDAGMSLQNTNFDDGTTKLNAGNSSFDYVAMQFRLFRGMGMTVGLLPFSHVGYSISNYNTNDEKPEATNTEIYEGDGGLRQVFLGLGYAPIKNLSVGANVSYLWGDINRYRTVNVKGTGAYNFSEANYLSVKDFKLDFGAQYSQRISRKEVLTLGMTFSPGKELHNEASVYSEKTVNNSSTSGGYTVIENNQRDTVATYEIPVSFGVGLAYVRDERLTVALDYSLQKWGDATYMNKKNAFCDRSKISFGVEYLPSYISRSYFAHIKYRFGAYYSTPYYKFEDNGTGYRAANEFGISAGISLPVPRSLSRVHLSGQYIRVSGQKNNVLNENYLRLSIGVTFNERWFIKQKVK